MAGRRPKEQQSVDQWLECYKLSGDIRCDYLPGSTTIESKTRTGKEMIALLQRVSSASVSIEQQQVAVIERGLLVLVAVHRDDTERDIARLCERILGYRVFEDASGRMNLSVSDITGGLLLVPQFTLAADTRKGTRASFTKGAAPDIASDYFDRLVAACRKQLQDVQTGRFGADMQVSLVNDGPVTFWLET